MTDVQLPYYRIYLRELAKAFAVGPCREGDVSYSDILHMLNWRYKQDH